MQSQSLNYLIYRLKYRYGQYINLKAPVDVSLELASSCNQACGYCLHPDSLVLKKNLTSVKIKDLVAGDEVVSFDEEKPGASAYRKMRTGIVERVWKTKKQAIRITTENSQIICSLDHRFLCNLGRWRFAKNLKVGDELSFGVRTLPPQTIGKEYKIGYLRGIYEGDGTARWEKKSDTSAGRQTWWRVALKDKEPLERITNYLTELEIPNVGIRGFDQPVEHYSRVYKVEFRSKKHLVKLKSILYQENIENNLEFQRGYLAGIFDSEGSFSKQGILRISQIKDIHGVIERTSRFLNSFYFEFVVEDNGLRLLGSYWDKIYFLSFIESTIERKKDAWDGLGVQHHHEVITNIESVGELDLIDIQTSTKTFYANGFATHNCYHADPKNLPFKKGLMSADTATLILNQAKELGVNSLKFNYRGEPTLNPQFRMISYYAKRLASGSTFIDRVVNSNFKFLNSNDDIFIGLGYMTKVKVSFDSFRKEIFEKQRKGGIFEAAVKNVDRFYNWPGRNADLVIQAVRTKLNADEDLEGEIKRRWPSAIPSVRNVVEGRVDKDIKDLVVKDRSDERQSCLQAHVRLIFDHTGMAQMCCPDISSKLQIGNIKVHSMSEIFNSIKAKQLRKSLKNKTAFEQDPCNGCSSFESYKGYKHPWNS
jgi:hypothetical protein